MAACFFVSDLHGNRARYQALFSRIVQEVPAAVFMGGDLLPSGILAGAPFGFNHVDFVTEFLALNFATLRGRMGESYPRVFLILGNDDPRAAEVVVEEAGRNGLWEYVHKRKAGFAGFEVVGYACVPPTPFLLKDWERYDISRYVDPGSVSPEEGYRTVPVSPREITFATIAKDLAALFGDGDLSNVLCLFHAPPYQTLLDRSALDGHMVDGVPVDVHIGSIAVRRFIEERQPYLTLHGHAHESARILGDWRDRLGRTWMFSAAHDGPHLALVRFDLATPDNADRVLIPTA